MQKNYVSVGLFVLISLIVLGGCVGYNKNPSGIPRQDSSYSGKLSLPPSSLPVSSGSIPEVPAIQEEAPSQAYKQASKQTPKQLPKSETAIPSQKTIQKRISYRVPEEGMIATDFSVVITSDGIVQSVVASLSNGDRESRSYHNRFNRNINAQVSGKKASEISFDAVGGASLTTAAFHQVLYGL